MIAKLSIQKAAHAIATDCQEVATQTTNNDNDGRHDHEPTMNLGGKDALQ